VNLGVIGEKDRSREAGIRKPGCDPGESGTGALRQILPVRRGWPGGFDGSFEIHDISVATLGDLVKGINFPLAHFLMLSPVHSAADQGCDECRQNRKQAKRNDQGQNGEDDPQSSRPS